MGKIYAGLLILESWKTTRFGQIEGAAMPVSERFFVSRPKNIHEPSDFGPQSQIGRFSLTRLNKVTHEYISLSYNCLYTFDHVSYSLIHVIDLREPLGRSRLITDIYFSISYIKQGKGNDFVIWFWLSALPRCSHNLLDIYNIFTFIFHLIGGAEGSSFIVCMKHCRFYVGGWEATNFQ